MKDTTQAVYEIIAQITKKNPKDLLPESQLAEDLGMKSVSRIELAALLEDRLGIVIDNFEIRRPKTIAQVVELVGSKQ